MVQYLTNSKFYFEIDGITDLFVKTCSGPEIEMEVAGGDAPIGVTKGGKTQTQSTIGGVKYSSGITLTYIAGNESHHKKLSDWYNSVTVDGATGGASDATKNRKSGSLTIYDPDGKEAMRYDFTDLFPTSKKQTSSVGVDQGGSLAEDTLEMKFTKVVRVK